MTSSVAGFRCIECDGDHFPEGIRIVFCPLCEGKVHAGCWPRHEARHRETDAGAFEGHPVRRGIVGAYGVIRWIEPEITPGN